MYSGGGGWPLCWPPGGGGGGGEGTGSQRKATEDSRSGLDECAVYVQDQKEDGPG